MDFHVIKKAVADQFALMQKHTLFKVGPKHENPEKSHRDQIWETYIGSFRKEDDPIYRERTEHYCSCCRGFIRTIGDVVSIIDGKMVTVWDVDVSKEPGYQIVADAMAAYIRSLPIKDYFLHYERSAGTDKNFEELTSGVKTWEHFFVNLPAAVVMPASEIPTKLGTMRESKNVLKRGLEELTIDSTDTVLELIAQNSLYRGAEHTKSLTEFRKLQNTYAKLNSDKSRDLFAWYHACKVHGAVSRIRNTSIGTLLIDLSEGKELEQAVRAFESVVAPANYKRPTALVTKAMVERAKKDVEELGLTSALGRRFATLEDVSVNDVLFANRNARKAMKDNVFDEVETASINPKTLDRVEEVSIDKFLSDILPKADNLEVLVENRHIPNFVSLIAPTDSTAGRLFKWDNPFSWAYNGDMADSIKERVKKAGGSITGDLCCRLAWHNYDDLDLHMHEPDGSHIFFAKKRSYSGELDVDMNAGYGRTREPVENIFYLNRRRMPEGKYRLQVHNFNQRESKDVGFEVEIEVDGETHTFTYEKAVRNNEYIDVACIHYSKDSGFTVEGNLQSNSRSRKMWNLDTQKFHKVSLVSLSPNYWLGDGVGNKHYMFMLADCVNDGVARGFFNEFLDSSLDKHRKVLEMVGSKVKTQPDDHQLSGLGFSSTQRNSIVCRVSGKFSRLIKVQF